ncbi:MAG: helix-turn-helix domain-containing protein [Xanthomonadaceae bacterium]|nr:helix-turn-helix domain-containing protein [Xanthomonadaceae bacterium]MDZ4377123.1 helix-turn-helix domain-containing protein [Xanthomonadaceae bacterium]
MPTYQSTLIHSVSEAAHRLGLGRTKIYELIGSGQLRPIRIGRRVLIPESELQRLIDTLIAQAASTAGDTT